MKVAGIVPDHRFQNFLDRGRCGGTSSPQQLQEQRRAIMGIGLDTVESQYQATGIYLPPLDVVERQEIPTGLGRGRVNLEAPDPGRLGLIESHQAIQGVASTKMEDDSHRRILGRTRSR